MSSDFSAFIELDGDDKLSPKLERAAVAFDRLQAAATAATAGMRAGAPTAQAYGTALAAVVTQANTLAPKLNSVATATNAAGAAARNSANHTQALGAGLASANQQMAAMQRGAMLLGGPVGGLMQVSSGLTAVTGAAFAVGAGLAVATVGVLGTVAAVGYAAYSIGTSLVDAFENSIKAGVEFNQLMETGRLGLAATTLSYSEITDAQGKALSSTEQFAGAMAFAADSQERLRMAAFQTTATLQQLQVGYGMLAAGGERLGATNAQVVELTKSLSNLAAIRKIPMETAFNQMALILQGVARSTGRVAVLMKGLGVNKATLESWEKHGEVVTNVLKALKPYADIGEEIQKSFQGRLSNVMDVWEQLSGVMSKPLFSLATDEMGKFVDVFVDLSGKMPKFRDDAVGSAAAIGTALSGMAEMVLSFGKRSFDELTGHLKDEKDTWTQTFVEMGKSAVEFVASLERGINNMIFAARIGNAVLKELKADFKALTGDAADDKGSTLSTDIFMARLARNVGMVDVDTDKEAALAKLSAIAGKEKAIAKDVTDSYDKKRRAQEASLNTKAIEAAARSWDDLERSIQKKAGLAAEDDPFKRALLKNQQDYDDATTRLDAAAEKKWGGLYAKQQRYIDAVELLGVVHSQSDIDAERAHWDEMGKAAVEGARAMTEAIQKEYDEGDAADKRDALYEKQMASLHTKIAKGYDDEVEIQKAHHAQIILEETRKFEALGDLDDAARALIAQHEAKFRADDLALEKAYAASKIGDYQAMGLTLVNVANKTVADMKKAYAKSADIALNDLSQKDNPAAGIYAGTMTIMSQTKTIAEATSDYITDVWRTAKQGFNDILVDGITTGFSNIGKILRKMSDDYAKDFTSMLTEMVSSWFAAQNAMGAGGGSGGSGMSSTDAWGAWTGTGSVGGGGGPTWSTGGDFGGDVTSGTLGSTGSGSMSSAGGLAAAGLGVAASAFGNATGGAADFGQGISPYLAAAATIATATGYSLPGLIVAAAVALVGLVVNLLNPDTEQTYAVTAKNLKLTSAGDFANDPSATGRMIAKSEAGGALIDARNKTVGTLFDLFTLGAKDSATALSKIVNDKLTEYLLAINFEVHAGSDEDITKDFKYLFEKVMPREMLAKLFGMKGGGLDIAGISGGQDFSTYSMSTAAPLTNFLTMVGFSMAKIKDLAMQSQTTDPTLFLDRLKKIVTVVVGFNEAMSTSAKSFSTLVTDYQDAKGKSDWLVFADSRDAIMSQLSNLGSFSGDEQIARAETALEAINKRFEDMAKYVAQLAEAMDQAAAKTIDMKTSMQDALKSPEWIEADLRNMFTPHDFGVAPAISRIQNATTPAEAQRMFDLATSQLQQFFDILVNRLHQAQAQIVTNDAVWTKYSTFGVPGTDLGTMAGLRQGTNDLSAQRAAALAITDPQKQLDAIARVDAAAETMYEAQISMLHKIEDQAKALTESVADQIRGMQLDGMSDEQRKSFLTSEIATLRAQIATTTDPARLKEITDKIQSDAAELWRMHQADKGTNAATAGNPYYDAFKNPYDGDYYAAFGAGRGSGAGAAGAQDPFAKFLEDILNGTNAAAQAAYAGMHTTVNNAAEQTKRDLELVGVALQNLITGPGGLNDQIQATIGQLDQLKDAFWHAMKRFGDAAIATNTQAFIDAMEIARARFTELNLVLDPETGLPIHVKDASESLDDLREAARRLKDKFDAFDTPTGGGSGNTGGGNFNPITTGSPGAGGSSYSQVRNNRSGLRTYTQ